MNKRSRIEIDSQLADALLVYVELSGCGTIDMAIASLIDQEANNARAWFGESFCHTMTSLTEKVNPYTEE